MDVPRAVSVMYDILRLRDGAAPAAGDFSGVGRDL